MDNFENKNSENTAKKKKLIFKRWWFWLVIVLVLFIGFAASGEDDSGPQVINQNETTSQNAQSEKKDIFSVGESVELDGAIVTVNSVKRSSGSEWDKPKAGHEYIIIKVTIKNSGNTNLSYNPYDFTMQNSQGTITDNAFTIIDSDTQLNSGELVPGGQVSGTIAFEQPVNDNGLVLIYEGNIWNEEQIKFSIK